MDRVVHGLSEHGGTHFASRINRSSSVNDGLSTPYPFTSVLHYRLVDSTSPLERAMITWTLVARNDLTKSGLWAISIGRMKCDWTTRKDIDLGNVCNLGGTWRRFSSTKRRDEQGEQFGADGQIVKLLFTTTIEIVLISIE